MVKKYKAVEEYLKSEKRFDDADFDSSFDTTKLFNLCQEKKDDPFYMAILGECYYMGLGVEKDINKADECFQICADNNNPRGLYNLGYSYEMNDFDGFGDAKYYYEQAANQGSSYASYKLGMHYRFDFDFFEIEPEDAAKASLKWLKLALDQGNCDAAYQLGIIYEGGKSNGEVVESDLKLAANYYKIAVDGGIVDAQFDLGCMYLRGEGVDEDFNEAVRLFKLSASNKNSHAIEKLKIMHEYGDCSDKDYNEALELFNNA